MNHKRPKNRVGSRTMKKALLDGLDQTERPIMPIDTGIGSEAARKLLIDSLAEGVRIRRKKAED